MLVGGEGWRQRCDVLACLELHLQKVESCYYDQRERKELTLTLTFAPTCVNSMLAKLGRSYLCSITFIYSAIYTHTLGSIYGEPAQKVLPKA